MCVYTCMHTTATLQLLFAAGCQIAVFQTSPLHLEVKVPLDVASGGIVLHPVSVRRFPSFRTQPLENLSHYL